MGILLLCLHWALIAFLVALTLRAVFLAVPVFVRDWEPQGGLLVLAEFVLTITDPPIRFLGRFLPPIRVGDIQLDTAFICLFLAVSLASAWL